MTITQVCFTQDRGIYSLAAGLTIPQTITVPVPVQQPVSLLMEQKSLTSFPLIWVVVTPR